MTTFFFIQLFFAISVLCQSQLTYYIDQSTATAEDQQDGSQSSPFSSLNTAFQAISEGVVDIVFVGQTYALKESEAYQSLNTSQVTINMRASAEDFTLKFSEEGQIKCENYRQLITDPSVKNVNISFTNMNIETQSGLPLFCGDCYFSFEDIFIKELRSPLLMAKSEGSALLRRFTIDNIVLGENQNLIDQDSRERIEADYLILDTVKMKNTAKNSDGKISALIRSFMQYKFIEVKNSLLEGVTFSIKGEQIEGNNKTDIHVENVTMTNAENFFFIESYGTLLVEGSNFTTASNRAFFFFLTDEDLSPISATFINSAFSDNAVMYAGGAIAFQGSKETNYQLSVDAVISNCQFNNNNASFGGGALALLFLKNANISIKDCEFSSNTAGESGGAIYINRGESTMSIEVKRSLFKENSAFSGGVFGFEFLNGAKIILDNNTYINNSAKLQGGIGYVSESKLTLIETNSGATGNQANFQGGDWYFESESDVIFQNVQFKNSRAFLRGGCISNSGASLTLTRVSFENCILNSVSSQGGAVHVGDNASVKISDCEFTNNLAELGAAIAIQSLKATPQILEGITLSSNVKKLTGNAPTVKSQIRLNYGQLVLKNLVAPNLQAPFLSQIAGKADIKNVTIAIIECDSDDESLSFCMLGIQKSGSNGQSFTIEDLHVENAVSTIPLLTSQGSSVSINSVVVDKMDLPGDIPVWDIRNSVFKAGKVKLMDLDQDFFRLTNSHMEIVDSNFEYEKKQAGVQNDQVSSVEVYNLIPKER